MPELGEQMYSSQQICIPPTFPYLLRQFAKAAIRTQPNDLLKWSTTYFRCLALNIPPPVKPRLEYPIPKDYHGMTPGWLRALLFQMAGSQTVTFKVLWDRWIGACLQHPNLIQILCLGGFEDNMAVPWLRFIGLCAAHLTENLTQTMILICEILTEEPEGGSAMIKVDTFVDLYQFLAQINASAPQTIRNYYFLDKFLDLFRERIAKDSGEKPTEEEEPGDVFSLISTESSVKSEKESKREDEISVASCPSVTSQDPDNYMRLLMKIREGEEGEFYGEELKAEPVPSDEVGLATKDQSPGEQSELPDDVSTRQASIKLEEDDGGLKKQSEVFPKKFSEQLEEDKKMDIFPTECDDLLSRDTQPSTDISYADVSKKEISEKLEDNEYLIEDLERLRAVQQELMGESDDDLEKYKASILADAGLTPSQILAPEHFEQKLPEVISLSESIKSDVCSTSESLSEKEKLPVDEREYEDVYVDAVPGIGPKIPEEMIFAVVNYMKEVATMQHGMVMPRNIRHYECPPLEFFHK